MDDFSSRKEKTDYLMLEALKFREINDTSHFIGTEHPIHRCFQELNRDVCSYKYLTSLVTIGYSFGEWTRSEVFIDQPEAIDIHPAREPQTRENGGLLRRLLGRGGH